MDSSLTTVGLPIALAVIMFGLGLDLTLDDFRRVGRHPRAVTVALACQLVLLPMICFGLVVLLDLPPPLGIGMLLLAASPGGTTANLFSHLFHGDVALNLSLTAINSVIALFTLPFVTGLAMQYYDRADDAALPIGEVVRVFAIVLVPVAIGMIVRHREPWLARRMERSVRVGSVVILALLVVGILVGQWDYLSGYFTEVGIAAGLFCGISLVLGYVIPKAAGVAVDQAIASSMEIGLHNATLAIFVAVEVLDETEISVPAAVYSLVMVVLASIWGTSVSRRSRVEAVTS